MQTLKAIIFDLDGVITDTAEFHYLAWKALGEELEIPFDRTFNETLKGVSRMDSLERILELGGQENAFSPAEKHALAEKKNAHYVQLIQQITPNDLLPGILNFLKKVKAASLQTAIASASKNAMTVIHALKVGGYFDYIVDANEVMYSKPNPEVFLKAAAGLGVSPSHCVGIEDAAAGITAINRAGMFSVGVGEENVLREAKLVLSSTKELTLKTIKKAMG